MWQKNPAAGPAILSRLWADVRHGFRGDHDALKIWSDSVRGLAAGIASVINVVDPELVVIGGRIQLVSPERAAGLAGFSRVQLEGRPPVLVRGEMAQTLEQTRTSLACSEVRLAGRLVES